VERSVAITMRTPGDDAELAVGFLLSEGIVRSRADVSGVTCHGMSSSVQVELADDVHIDLGRLERHFYATSSCGVCGKSSLDALAMPNVTALTDGFVIDAPQIARLPERLRAAQPLFDVTGGLHAAALFSRAGQLLGVREDVGRHNAVDKLIGSRFLDGQVPIHDALLFVSGRASFELVQKAVVAGIPLLAAVGAPSSLAVELAERYQLSLIGFVRDQRFNIYCGTQRISRTDPAAAVARVQP
jgi:FdhD protein